MKFSQLRKKLRPYGLDRPTLLARALGVKRQRAGALLTGKPYGPLVARRIAKVIGLSWQEVYSWQDGGPRRPAIAARSGGIRPLHRP